MRRLKDKLVSTLAETCSPSEAARAVLTPHAKWVLQDEPGDHVVLHSLS